MGEWSAERFQFLSRMKIFIFGIFYQWHTYITSFVEKNRIQINGSMHFRHMFGDWWALASLSVWKRCTTKSNYIFSNGKFLRLCRHGLMTRNRNAWFDSDITNIFDASNRGEHDTNFIIVFHLVATRFFFGTEKLFLFSFHFADKFNFKNDLECTES